MNESYSIFFVFLLYSFINLVVDTRSEPNAEEPFIGTVAYVVGNYIGSGITFFTCYFAWKCFSSLF